ncbi:hypothetical protein ACRAJ3_25135 [Rhodococcus pyridinivorans]|uniref:hypothetical protein n=1 Tax=Rhodococcus pyridinivorans TaxID=103816 RepID=UPI003D7F7565
MIGFEEALQKLSAEYAAQIRETAMKFALGTAMNRWQCNACDAIRQAPCGKSCLPADHYDPRDARETAAVLDFEDGFHE